MTNVITNAAAAAFMFPIAVTTAAGLGVSFEPFAVILMLGCSYAFINPAGYQTNLMVQKPGGYSFIDYAKVGVPLTVILGIVAIWLAPARLSPHKAAVEPVEPLAVWLLRLLLFKLMFLSGAVKLLSGDPTWR